jgi:endogenous inhibitor of DNA gyrase (YacG/DUF329 family)
MARLKCELCGHVWESRKATPNCCPRCKRYDFKQKRKGAIGTREYNETVKAREATDTEFKKARKAVTK